MSIFRRQPSLDASYARFDVHSLPDSPSRDKTVLGILSSVSLHAAGIQYTIYLKKGGFHNELRTEACRGLKDRKIEELVTRDGVSFPYTAFSIDDTAYYGLLPPEAHLDKWRRQYKFYRKVLELGCAGLSVVAREYQETDELPPLGSKLSADKIREAKKNVVSESATTLTEYAG